MTRLNIGQFVALHRQEIARYSGIDDVRDESGRLIAPPQSVYPERPVGPWTTNADQRGA